MEDQQEAACLIEQGGHPHAGATTVVLSLLGVAGMNRSKLITSRRRELVGGCRIKKTHPAGGWLATSPGGPVILGKGNNAAHNGLVKSSDSARANGVKCGRRSMTAWIQDSPT